MQCKIDDLPDEILEYILNLIPPYKDLQACMLVCKRWCQVTRNMIEHKEARFQKSVAFGSLYWKLSPLIHQQYRPIGKRYSHSACVHKNSMWVFGGCTASCTTFNDLWRFDLHTREWIRPIAMGRYPSPKACATMLYHKNSFILFGGWSQPSPYPHHQLVKFFDELHVYCIKLNKWCAINSLGGPPAMSAHSASIHGNLMVVFGGICNSNISNDVWCLNLDTYCWHKQPTSELMPHPRYGQSQIELDDKHLLILGGCAGPNDSINDVWLLTMEGVKWTWRKVNIRHPESAPSRIWCHQACKVGNYIVVIGIKKRQTHASDMSITARANCQRPAPAQMSMPTPQNERRNNQPRIDRDENVNGRHGSFRRLSPPAQPSPSPPTIHHPFKIEINGLSMAAFRDESLRPPLTLNRQRQLESLRRMEEKIQSRRDTEKVPKKRKNTLAIFVLDITKVLCEECVASWVQLKHNERTGPDERILYSLVLGRDELILFGGIRREQDTIQGQPETDDSKVFNEVYFLSPPRYIL